MSGVKTICLDKERKSRKLLEGPWAPLSLPPPLSQNSQENTCARVSFLKCCRPEACNFINKETLAQVFSSEFYKISKSTFSYRAPPVAASERLPSYSELKHDTHRNCSKSPSCYFDLQAIELIIVPLSFFPIPLSWNTIYCPPLSQSDSKYFS